MRSLPLSATDPRQIPKESHPSAKEPYVSVKEPSFSAKELHLSAKEPYVSAKEPNLCSKELYLSAKEPYRCQTLSSAANHFQTGRNWQTVWKLFL